MLSRHALGCSSFELQPQPKLSASFYVDRQERQVYQLVQARAATMVETVDLRYVAFIEILSRADHRMRNANEACSACFAAYGLELLANTLRSTWA